MTRILLVMLATAVATAVVDVRARAPRLVAGASFEQLAGPGSTTVFDVDLAAGDVLDLSATQDRVLVKFTLIEPDETTRYQFDLPQIHPLPDRLIHVARVSGPHRLEVVFDGVNSRAPTAGQPGFTLTVQAAGPAGPADLARAKIARVAAAAGELVGQRTLDGIERSIPLWQEAADGWRALGEPRLEATTLRALGYATAFFTQFRLPSAAAWERQIPLWHALGEIELEWDSWRSLNVEYADDGRSAEAREAGQEAMRLSSGFADRTRYGADLRRAAFDELLLGDYDEARRLAGESLDIGVAVHDAAVQALALDILARLQALSGDLHAAIEHQSRAIGIAGQGPVRRQLLMTLGGYQLAAREHEAAEASLIESLALSGRMVQREWDALTRTGLGDVALARGDRAGARSHYARVRELLVTSRFEVYRCTLESHAGRLEMADGQIDAARARFAEALTIAERLGLRECEANARTGLADVAVAVDRPDDARAQALRVVDIVETFRDAAIGLDARTLGFATLAPAYDRAVALTMRLESREAGRAAEALLLHERVMARGLLDGLTAERLARRARVPPALADERRRLREAWRARVVEHETAVQRNAVERAATLGDEIATLGTRWREVEARIDAIDPRHASFVRPPPLDVDGIRALLGSDTVLVEYGLGDVQSYAWTVDDGGVRAFTLAPRATIEAAARRAHEALAAPTPQTTPASTVAPPVRELAQLVLDPIAAGLTKPRVVVVAPGALALVPFGVLPMRRAPGAANGEPDQPLLERHELVSLPSATVLAARRVLDAKRARPAKSAAVFADPVYERDDPRLTGAASSERSGGEVEASDARQVDAGPRGVALKRLPFSRREAAAIERYAPTPPLRVTGLDATRERVLAGDLENYRVVHFAAHGLVQADVPNLSGVALSLVDRRGRPRNGFLMLPDVYELTLNADLVVLSACQTALGLEVRGEGLLGLPRGFMYAGASRVISSLWRVDDEATAALMEAFYRRLFREHLTPAAALRGAQLELRRTPRWRAPFFWAGFVLQGDWR